jgi:hypothetical protein
VGRAAGRVADGDVVPALGVGGSWRKQEGQQRGEPPQAESSQAPARTELHRKSSRRQPTRVLFEKGTTEIALSSDPPFLPDTIRGAVAGFNTKPENSCDRLSPPERQRARASAFPATTCQYRSTARPSQDSVCPHGQATVSLPTPSALPLSFGPDERIKQRRQPGPALNGGLHLREEDVLCLPLLFFWKGPCTQLLS